MESHYLPEMDKEYQLEHKQMVHFFKITPSHLPNHG